MIKMKVFSSFPAILLLTIGLLLPATGTAAPCTPGADCYCDKVKNPGSPFYDPNLLMCEDFEAPTLRDTTTRNQGGGAPYYGPWWDDTGGSGACFRGYNSYWYRIYGPGNGNLIDSGLPRSPTLGCTCQRGGGACGYSVWEYRDAFGHNRDVGAIAILTAGEFNEIAGNTDPTNAAGGRAGQFDGNASVHWRVTPGETTGIAGTKRFGARYQEIGITGAWAFPKNLPRSGIQSAHWKFAEWGDS